MKIKATILFIFLWLISFCITAQTEASINEDYEDERFRLRHRISLGNVFGKRSSEISHHLSLQYLSFTRFRSFDFGLGVNFENEYYFDLIPLYMHVAYPLAKLENSPKAFLHSGLAFNSQRDFSYTKGQPGLLIAGGFEQDFSLGKRLGGVFQLLYRFHQTSTIEEWPSYQNPDQNALNSDIVKYSMHRIMLVVGINF